MVVEIRNVHHRNKGAELMLKAIVAHYADRPDITLTANHRVGSRRQLRALGIRPLLFVWRKRGFVVPPAAVVPSRLRLALGVVHPEEVDIVLDAAGFAYGDQWGTDRAVAATKYYRYLKQHGARVVLMPQSLGPFTEPSVRDTASALFEQVDLLFPRDDTASACVAELLGDDDPRVFQCPDFTPLCVGTDGPELPSGGGEPSPGELPSGASDSPWRGSEPSPGELPSGGSESPWGGGEPSPGELPSGASEPPLEGWPAAIIPNRKMIQKGGLTEGAYVALLAEVVQRFAELGYAPFMLPHATFDHALAVAVRRRSSVPVPVVVEPDALRLKHAIGRCHAVFSSRFHGLVSALSQGVPVIATGWSHKYKHLLDEYGCPDALVDVSVAGSLGVAMDRTLAGDRYDATRAVVRERAAWNKERASEMWTRIDDLTRTT